MNGKELRQEQWLQMRPELRLALQLEQAQILEMSEEEFNRLVSEIESSALFKRLYLEERIVRYQRYPKTDISPRFYQLKEEIIADTGNLDLESLLSGREEVIGIIQRIGIEDFKRYFLYPESEIGLEEIARRCNLAVSDVEKINDLINQFSIMSEFYHPSAFSFEPGIRYSKVASIERGPEGFIVGYFSPAYARGRYLIDYEKLEKLRKSGVFTKAEEREIRLLLRKLELINRRKDTLTQILQTVIERQVRYLDSRNPKALLPLSQKELARKIGVAQSSVSRAIRGRSIEMPWGEERPLKDFFPRPRSFRKELVRELLESEDSLSSDEEIRARLQEKFGVAISRRSVANLRKELRIAPRGRKNKS